MRPLNILLCKTVAAFPVYAVLRERSLAVVPLEPAPIEMLISA